jgi:hypothetical protein
MNAADALLQNTRAEQRRLKLQEAEREQQAEELEALKITDVSGYFLPCKLLS